MKKTLWLFASLACLTAVLFSCSRTADPEGYGYVELRVSTDPGVDRAATRATGDGDVVAVTIYEGSEVLWSCEDASTVTEPLTFLTGLYTAEAVCGSDESAAWDFPFYSCTEKFGVYTDKNTDLDLVLTLSNVKVTAEFSDDFDTYFTSYDLSVTNGTGTLDYDKDTESREGYFSVTGTLRCTLSLTNTDGDSYTLQYDYDDVVARQYYAFSFSIQSNENADGAAEITIILDDTMNEKRYSFDIDVTDPTVTTIYADSAEPWAMFANLTGYWSGPQPEGLGFEYRKSGASSWTTANADVTVDGYYFYAQLCGLDPETSYEFRAVATDVDASSEISFTTESAQTVPNLNFDSWCTVSGYDSPNESSDNIIWDTANGGTSIMSVYPTTKETDHVVSNSAVRMESKVASLLFISKFAAGNIYTGQFGSISVSSMSATLDWGYEFSSRPLALKGWYDYSPATVDHSQSPYSDMAGSPDIGQIQIFLTDWDEPFTVNSGNEQFVDFTADYIIARGQLLLTEDSGGSYTEFTLPLEYYDTTKTPTYIVITCSASAYGDYFTGGTGSTLYVDEFSLVYDPTELD
ncbi:MAG: PCMD domain-containing protein [Bacteroidales bacterium]|nr:PCMD domain-containing protein [Bacteroidales bacterium]